MEKKNVDHLYQEKLDGYSVPPDERVWQRIEASLDKKQKKRVVPLWWYGAGAAAVVILALLVAAPNTNGTAADKNSVADTENELPTLPENATDQPETSTNGTLEEPLKKTKEGMANASKEKSFEQKAGTYGPFVAKEPRPNPLAKVEKNKEKTQSNKNGTKNEALTAESELALETVRNTPKKKNTPISFKGDVKHGAETEGELVEDTKKKSIFEVVEAQNEEVIAKEGPQKKWSLQPAVAPVYFNAFGEGSPIHSDFSQNAKSGNVNLSYGITLSYCLSDKIRLRSGVHRVDYGYNTDGISFTSTVAETQSNQIENIDYASSSSTLVVENRSSVELATNSRNSDVAASSASFDGSMVQQLGYVEVPVELTYALLDKKFGVTLISGVSSLFLIDNAVTLESDGLVTEMGEANNVNATNFSTNVGLGIHYSFSKKVNLNLEPMFKYQLRTFSNTAGSFNPYSVGVYSGLSIKL